MAALNPAALLKAHGLHPKKSLGQNFLVDPVALDRVVQAAEIRPEDEVLEIGAGLGSLTQRLAGTARRVVAVEIDRSLFPILAANLNGYANVDLQLGDMLEIDPGELFASDGYIVAANIPYYISSALIRHLLAARVRPARMALTVQKEVAERITAAPGHLSILALSIQVFGSARIAARIPAGAFYPAPKVDSAVVRIDLFPQPAIPPHELDDFFKLVKAGFGQKRKTLRNTLSTGLRLPVETCAGILSAAGIDTRRRAETLTIEEWGNLVKACRTAFQDLSGHSPSGM